LLKSVNNQMFARKIVLLAVDNWIYSSYE